MNNSSPTNATIEASSIYISYAVFTVVIPATFANLLAIIIFGRSFYRGAPVVNLFLLCLGCTDFLGCFYAYYATVSPLYEQVHTPAFCHFIGFVGSFVGLLSALFAALLAIDRYFALCKPYVYSVSFDRKRCFLYILAVILISTLVSILNAIGLGTSYYVKEGPDGSSGLVCSSRVFQETPHKRIAGYIYTTVGFCILLVVVTCNVRVILTVLKMKRNIQSIDATDNEYGATRSTSLQAEVKFARVIGVLSVTLIVCWVPFMINASLSQMDVRMDPNYLIVSHVLVVLNFIVDPFVFLMLRRSYRHEAAQLLFGYCCSTKRPSGQRSSPSTRISRVDTDVDKT